VPSAPGSRFAFRPLAAFLLVSAFILVAGCSSLPSEPMPSSTTTRPSDGAAGSNATAAHVPRLGAPRSIDLYLTPDGGLATVMPGAGSVAAGTAFTGIANGGHPVRFASAPLDHAVLIEKDLAATLFIQSPGPRASNTLFDLGLWFGRAGVNVLSVHALHEAAIAPGAVTRHDVALAFDGKRGLLVPAGEPLVLFVQADPTPSADLVQLLMGPDTPSRLNVTLRDYAVDPLLGASETERKTLTGQAGPSSFAICDPAPGTTSATHTIDVAPAARSLRLALEPDGAPTPAIDLDLRLSDGSTLLAASSNPGPQEGVFLAAETLAGLQGKSLQLTIHACQNGVVPYTVHVWQS
jgi:hypothetical protein